MKLISKKNIMNYNLKIKQVNKKQKIIKRGEILKFLLNNENMIKNLQDFLMKKF